MNGKQSRCIIALGSLTQAIKGQRRLGEKGIPSSVARLSPSVTKNGCAYGIITECFYMKSAKAVLSDGGIRYSQIVTEDGELY